MLYYLQVLTKVEGSNKHVIAYTCTWYSLITNYPRIIAFSVEQLEFRHMSVTGSESASYLVSLVFLQAAIVKDQVV